MKIRDISLSSWEERGLGESYRTFTEAKLRQILSLVCLPVPPLRVNVEGTIAADVEDNVAEFCAIELVSIILGESVNPKKTNGGQYAWCFNRTFI